MRPWIAVQVGLALAALASLGASGAGLETGQVRVLPAPGGPGWEALEFPSIPRHTRYTRSQVDGRAAVASESECSASALIRLLEGIDLAKTPLLRWDWKAERSSEAPDPRSRDGDDFAARVYLMFEFVPEQASLWARLRRGLLSADDARRLPGSALNYVVSGREPPGASWPNPWEPTAHMISLGAGAIGAWQRAQVDPAADYQRVFGRPAPRVIGIGLMTDSDNGCASAAAYFANFAFVPGEG